ncbi:Cysteine rich repeat protein [Labrenzia sp. THAF35]|uniref:cysteine rich repeat-containing protein n=1 Tax=Labrenzia sp. THAF35 TaxID=2587854 RepID=UPI001267B101|nr:cysteine rich repeat-containing protein [Labrenzia sp. THAF35]QFT67916.1 Cysteine rich repeat protein [Labrenzia sp. THAF35]
MTKPASLAVLFALVLASAAFLLPPPGRAQGVLEACEKSIEDLCSGVTPGNGRMISCLYAHEDHLDEACANTISDIGDILDHMFATIRDAMAVCADDIEKQCPNTEFGGGRIMSCLQENAADISPECRASVESFAAELAEE